MGFSIQVDWDRKVATLRPRLKKLPKPMKTGRKLSFIENNTWKGGHFCAPAGLLNDPLFSIFETGDPKKLKKCHFFANFQKNGILDSKNRDFNRFPVSNPKGIAENLIFILPPHKTATGYGIWSLFQITESDKAIRNEVVSAK